VLKKIGETALSGRPMFSAAYLVSTWQRTLYNGYTAIHLSLRTLFTVMPFCVFRNEYAASTAGRAGSYGKTFGN
jgi:hypothetical protein